MHLLCAISGHGLGHLAQTAPVLNALREMLPELRLTLWTSLPGAPLKQRIQSPFELRQEGADVGLCMHNAMHVDIPASQRAYLDFHAAWDARITQESAWLKRDRVDGVICNAAYLPLAAAHDAGIPGVGFSSLNWHDICQPYLGNTPSMASVFAQIRSAYATARTFYGLTPGLPLPEFCRSQLMPPVAGRGLAKAADIRAALNRPAQARLVLVGFGGVAYAAASNLPVLPDVVWLTPEPAATERTDIQPIAQLDMPFLDILASADALITKVGYGSYVEAAAHGIPVLYLNRPDWPESAWLNTWLHQHASACGISEAAFNTAGIQRALLQLWASPSMPEVQTFNVLAAATLLDALRN